MYLLWLKAFFNKYVVGGLAILASALGIYYWGYSDSSDDREKKDLEDYKETKERIDETPTNTDSDSALDRLRSNGDLR